MKKRENHDLPADPAVTPFEPPTAPASPDDAPAAPPVPPAARRGPFNWFGSKPTETPAPPTAAEDPLKRLAADFENYRRRTREEISQAASRGRRDLIAELLPALDALQAAVENGDKAGSVEAYAQGVVSTRQLLLETLRRHGVGPIPSVGEPFDPRIHEALQSLAECDAPVVIAEVRTGYQDAQGLLRPAQVIVGPAGEN